MKILLISPPSENIITTTQPSFIIRDRGLVPPLGLLYLATAVKHRTDHEVKILDCQLHGMSQERVKQEILAYQPDVVGISIVTFLLIDSLNVAGTAKDCSALLNKNITVVAGGPHTFLFPKETAGFDTIDFVLAGEAEFTFVSLLNNLSDFGKINAIPGIHYKTNGGIYEGPRYRHIRDLDSLPVPDRRLLDYDQYSNVLSRDKKMTTMMTSRGCPYRCIFCDRLGKKFRPVSAGRVVQEIESCLKLGISEIFFHDDTFTIDKKRVLKICDLIQKKSLNISFSLRSRVNTIDEEIIKALKRAGCQRISYGVESGVQDVLDRIKKGIRLEQVEETFALTQKYQIITLADFMIGHPGETVSDIMDTVKFAKKIRPDFAQFSITTPYPGTELYANAISEGIVKGDVWRHFAENPTPDFNPPRWIEHIGKDQLYDLIHHCYRQFYFSPSYLLRQLLQLKSRQEFFKKFQAGKKLAVNQLLLKLGKRRDGFR